MNRKKVTVQSWAFGIIAGVLFALICPFTAWAQTAADEVHEVTASAPAKRGDFVQARKRAVKMALRAALEEELENTMGEKSFRKNRNKLGSMLNDPESYVKSYRFLEAEDRPEEMVSEVLLQVSLYTDAVDRTLSGLGMLSGPGTAKSVIILVKESGLTPGTAESFWETVPYSEKNLRRQFVESKIVVVGREPVRDLFPEAAVLEALKGDVESAVRIGLKARADNVVLGNVVTTQISAGDKDEPVMVRSLVSVKVVSVPRSTVIAAKSDFAQAQNVDPLIAEHQALDAACKKISDFLVPALTRFWEGKDESPTAKTQASPLLGDDL